MTGVAATVSLLAQAEPMRLAGAPESSSRMVLLVVIGGVAVASLAITIWLWWRRSIEQRPDEHAFRGLSRSLGLGTADRRLVRLIAEAKDVEPVALLVSPRALAGAASSFVQANPGDPHRDRVRELARTLGGSARDEQATSPPKD